MDEGIVDPEMPVCDAHHHLLDAYGFRYLVPELLAGVGSGHAVDSTVYIECTTGYRPDGPPDLRPVGETEFVVGQPVPEGIMQAIVGFADPRMGPRIGEVLDAHQQAAGSRFRGVRFMLAWDAARELDNVPSHPGPGTMADDWFRAGMREIGRRGLTFDCWVYFHQLPDVADLASALPHQQLILDHLGGQLLVGPYESRHEEVGRVWAAGMAKVAACDNVALKIGGLNMHTVHPPWFGRSTPVGADEFADHWRDTVVRQIELFGVERCMFESNFPVDQVNIDYRTLWNAFKLIIQDFTPAERRAMLHDNAHRIYGIS